jgi:hypothetical protein
MNRSFRPGRPTVNRIIPLVFALFAFGCIKRTGPVATGPDKKSNSSSAALEEKNQRIASLPRTDLIGKAWEKAFTLDGEEAAKVKTSMVPVEGMPFAEAMRIELTEEATHEWAVQLLAKIAAPVEANDAILSTFFLRTETAQPCGMGETQFVFELAQGPYTKSITYPVQGSAEWSKVQIRFASAADYAAGEAQMIFRLGYDRQVIQLGGVKVENFAKSVGLGKLPATMTIDRRRERENLAVMKSAQATQKPIQEGGDLLFEIKPAQVIRSISPYVYGINSQPDDNIGVPVRRAGGNRQTAYNWEIDATNAGSDYIHSSDLWACTSLGFQNCELPGQQYLQFARGNKASNTDSLVVIPIQEWVVADRDGGVSKEETAPSKRWIRSLAKKPGSFSLTPDLEDGVVYQDELVNFLVQKLGRAADGGIKFYALDNEPALWPSTHPRVHPEKARYEEVISRSEAVAEAITRVDPTAFVIGGTMFGWSEFMSLSDAVDARAHNAKYGKDGTYIDYFLASMKALEAKHKRRLVHGLDIHWYPEAKGYKRITENDTRPKTIAARLQAPRSLWDPSYAEKSWIASQWGRPIRLIPWMLERIEERYAGTKLIMTEYDYGAGDHISGGLAQADVLGIFGREGMYMANYWGNSPANTALPPYIKAAFQMFRNYDGKHGTYGDTAVAANPADQDKASIYAATDSKRPGLMTILVINKEQQTSFNGKLDIKGGNYSKAQVFTMDSRKAEVRAVGSVDIKNNKIEYRLPPLTATLFVCQGK